MKVVWFFGLLFMGGCVLVIPSMHHSHEWTSVSRARWCASNQSSIDKCVGVWESQNIALPVDREIWIEVDSRGRIARVSPTVTELLKNNPVPERARLVPGSTVLYDFAKDQHMFRCASRVHTVREPSLDSHPESHYRFISSTEEREEFRGKKRGVICLFHKDVGPRDQPDAVHRRL